MSDSRRLAGKTALVTGGGTGIGAACALELAASGCTVAIAGRRADKLAETARRFSGEPAIRTRAADVGNRDDVAALFRWVDAELKWVDILINSAGVNVPKRAMAELTPGDWDQILGVNVTGAYHCMRGVLPQMRERGDGLIVNINSIAGIRGSTLGGVAYSASKFAMAGLGRTVALEERKNGIRVTNIYPGEVETPILDHRPVPVTAEHRARILQPEDVAAAVLMIACLPPRAHVAELVIKPTSQALE
jgi:NAD(P)-dependent dehydrogenase (short-subunit alcohol dehydrogenase family)